MLEPTCERILALNTTKANLSLGNTESIDGKMYFKCDFDGASSQSIYKMEYTSTSLDEARKNEESLFQTEIVPL